MSGVDVAFVVASLGAVGAAALAVTRRNPVHSAAWMMAALFAVAVVFLLLHSAFLAAIQVLLYAGAILVLFVFVIMLLNPGPEQLSTDRPPAWLRLLAGIGAAGLLGAIAAAIWTAPEPFAGASFGAPAAARPPEEFGEPAWFGRTVYDAYLLAFELVSLLVMAAVAGAVVLSKRKIEGARDAEPAPEEAPTPFPVREREAEPRVHAR